MTKYFKFRNANLSISHADGRGGYILKGMGLSLYVTSSILYDRVDSEIKWQCNDTRRDAYMLLKNH